MKKGKNNNRAIIMKYITIMHAIEWHNGWMFGNSQLNRSFVHSFSLCFF